MKLWLSENFAIEVIVMKKMIFFLFLSLVSMFSHASEKFDEARFKELQEAGEVILVDVSASWCPTCKKQEQVIKKWLNDHADKRLHVLKVDFDTQKKWVSHFRAPRQSTLILFKGEQQIWFSVAEDREHVIATALSRGFE